MVNASIANNAPSPRGPRSHREGPVYHLDPDYPLFQKAETRMEKCALLAVIMATVAARPPRKCVSTEAVVTAVLEDFFFELYGVSKLDVLVTLDRLAEKHAIRTVNEAGECWISLVQDATTYEEEAA